MKPIFYKGLWIFLVAFVAGCQREIKTEINSTGDLNLHFSPVVATAPLDFTSSFRNAIGETYTIKTFKFYIHKIELVSQSGIATTISNDYYLLDAANAGSLTLPLKAATNDYKAIAFTIGVDSARNVSGAQTNALDPANGMFWTWSTGYIMAKFEGISPSSSQPNNRFEFHIGGFKGDENVVKRIELPFPTQKMLSIIQGKHATIDINADANAWFASTNSLDIATHPVCMTPGALAKSFAENYYNMFRVTAIENN